jgi:uncharacterized ParB-like nuclease family protein
MSRFVRCRSFDDVFVTLGGVTEVARIAGCTPSAVCNWRSSKRASGRIPAKYYAVLAMALHGRGYYAPWSLFAFAGIGRRDAA